MQQPEASKAVRRYHSSPGIRNSEFGDGEHLRLSPISVSHCRGSLLAKIPNSWDLDQTESFRIVCLSD